MRCARMFKERIEPMLRKNTIVFAALLVVCGAVKPLLAGALMPVVPAGLSPGDKYHLVFVTDGTIDALSSNIDDYNDFVQSEAELNPSLTGTDVGVQWSALASTPGVNARDNAVVGANTPVFLLDGTTKLADGFNDFWDQFLLAPVDIDQYNQQVPTTLVWTGSMANGMGSATFELGGSGQATVQGSTQFSNTFWFFNSSSDPNNEAPLYALSQELTVPVPEPTAMITFAIGIGCLAVGGYVRSGRKNKTKTT